MINFGFIIGLRPPGKLSGFSFRNKSLFYILTYMLELHSGQSGEKIIVTLKELSTLDDPNYLFVFEHVETKTVVAVVMGADESLFTDRYNQFDINTAVLFADKPNGEWHYTAYEQASGSNIDPSLAFAPVEYGKMLLYSETEFEMQVYDQPVTFKSYGG